MADPVRGDVYLAHFGQTEGLEQGGKRPCLIVSDTQYNEGPAGLVVALPLTTQDWGIPWHVRLEPPHGGLDRVSFIMCDQVRTMAAKRLLKHLGRLHDDVMEPVSDRLRMLLSL